MIKNKAQPINFKMEAIKPNKKPNKNPKRGNRCLLKSESSYGIMSDALTNEEKKWR